MPSPSFGDFLFCFLIIFSRTLGGNPRAQSHPESHPKPTRTRPNHAQKMHAEKHFPRRIFRPEAIEKGKELELQGTRTVKFQEPATVVWVLGRFGFEFGVGFSWDFWVRECATVRSAHVGCGISPPRVLPRTAFSEPSNLNSRAELEKAKRLFLFDFTH